MEAPDAAPERLPRHRATHGWLFHPLQPTPGILAGQGTDAGPRWFHRLVTYPAFFLETICSVLKTHIDIRAKSGYFSINIALSEK